jgi:hypothetical protein
MYLNNFSLCNLHSVVAEVLWESRHEEGRKHLPLTLAYMLTIWDTPSVYVNRATKQK